MTHGAGREDKEWARRITPLFLITLKVRTFSTLLLLRKGRLSILSVGIRIKGISSGEASKPNKYKSLSRVYSISINQSDYPYSMDLMDSPSDLSYGASGPLFRIWSINSLLQSNVNADSHLDLSLKAQRICEELSYSKKSVPLFRIPLISPEDGGG